MNISPLASAIRGDARNYLTPGGAVLAEDLRKKETMRQAKTGNVGVFKQDGGLSGHTIEHLEVAALVDIALEFNGYSQKRMLEAVERIEGLKSLTDWQRHILGRYRVPHAFKNHKEAVNAMMQLREAGHI